MNRGCLGISNESLDYTSGDLVHSGTSWSRPGVITGNTLLGYQAGQSLNPSAVSTQFLTDGQGSLLGGTKNTCLGYQAGSAMTLATACTSIGYQAGPAGDAGQAVIIGHQAAPSLGTPVGSNPFQTVVIGFRAGLALTTGSENTLVGANAGAGITTASDNTIVGSNSSGGLLTGNANTLIGDTITVGVGSLRNCAALGQGANVQGSVNGGKNVAVGYQAKAYDFGISIGFQAGAGGASLTATGAVMIGYNSGNLVTSGINTFLGYQSGYAPGTSTGTIANATTTATGQTCLGSQTGQASASQVNYITCIGYETTAGAAGCVAIGADHTGAAATTSTQDVIALGTANHQVQLSNNTTGAGSALLGTNSPAVTNTAPYTWFKLMSSDGSTVYVPAWK